MAVATNALEKEALRLCDVLDKNPGELWDRRVTALREMTKLFEACVFLLARCGGCCFAAG